MTSDTPNESLEYSLESAEEVPASTIEPVRNTTKKEMDRILDETLAANMEAGF